MPTAKYRPTATAGGGHDEQQQRQQNVSEPSEHAGGSAAGGDRDAAGEGSAAPSTPTSTVHVAAVSLAAAPEANAEPPPQAPPTAYASYSTTAASTSTDHAAGDIISAASAVEKGACEDRQATTSSATNEPAGIMHQHGPSAAAATAATASDDKPAKNISSFSATSSGKTISNTDSKPAEPHHQSAISAPATGGTININTGSDAGANKSSPVVASSPRLVSHKEVGRGKQITIPIPTNLSTNVVSRKEESRGVEKQQHQQQKMPSRPSPTGPRMSPPDSSQMKVAHVVRPPMPPPVPVPASASEDPQKQRQQPAPGIAAPVARPPTPPPLPAVLMAPQVQQQQQQPIAATLAPASISEVDVPLKQQQIQVTKQEEEAPSQPQKSASARPRPTGPRLTPLGSPQLMATVVRPPTPPSVPAPIPPPAMQIAAPASTVSEDDVPLQQLKKQKVEQQEQSSAPALAPALVLATAAASSSPPSGDTAPSTTESAFAAAQAEAEALRKRVQELEERLKRNEKEAAASSSAADHGGEAEWDGGDDVKGGSSPNKSSVKRSRSELTKSTASSKSKKKSRVTAQVKEKYKPGFVDKDYEYYCTLDDETCGEVAVKLGCFWKDLALQNKKRYGSIREWDRFQEYTTLLIPKKAKKEMLRALARDDDDKQAVPKEPSMISLSSITPSPEAQIQAMRGLARTVENKSQHFTITAGDGDEAPLVPARMPSNDAARDPAVEMWANRLLGKEVEVFWDEEEDKDSSDENDYSDSDDEGDPTDWYEAKIVSYNPEDGIFGVEFVGDDTTIYRMELNKKIVRPSGRRLEDPRTVVEDRWRYLDSLARRKSIAKYADEFQEGEALNQALEDETAFRGSLRLRAQAMLRKSLLKGMKYMGIDPATDDDADAFCTMKSWELEAAIYQEYGQAGDQNGTHSKHQKLSGKYKAKVKMLKSNFEDIKNPTLAPRVLSGKLPLADLIKMSPEELAGRQTKLKRARAEEEAKKDIVLTPGIGTSPAKDKKVLGKTINTKEISAPPLTSTGAKTAAIAPKSSGTSIDIKALLQKKVKAAAAAATVPLRSPPPPKRPKVSVSSLMQAHPAPPPIAPDITAASSPPTYSQDPGTMRQAPGPAYQSPMPVAFGTAQGCPGYQPVPPVSFAGAAQGGQQYVATPSVPPARSGRVLNTNGGMRFRFNISGLVRTSFETCMVLEGNRKLAVDRYLPEKIPTESGRSPFNEMDKFIGSKLAGGRWMIAVLRLVDIHDEDAAKYKTFYKRYEEQGRIPLFKLPRDDAKLFLVTPKFTRARCLGGYITSYTASYAVILTRAGTLAEL